MFEEKNPNKPASVEDIFAGLDQNPSIAPRPGVRPAPVPASGTFRPASPPSRPTISTPTPQGVMSVPPPMGVVPHQGGIGKKILMILIIILILLIFGIGGWYVYARFFAGSASEMTGTEDEPSQKDTKEDINSSQGDSQTLPEDIPAENEEEPESQPLSRAQDTDGDGLNDEEETTLGTDFRRIDTDGDGLFDKEEVTIYKTNPLNPDTDGDSYEDGEEVKKLYNPNGPGKLFDVPKE